MALDNGNTPDQLIITPLTTLKSWFVTGAKPTQSQFHGLLNSYYHKSSQIPMSGISGLSTVLGNKADASQLQYYAKVDASNINTQAWKDALNVGELPPNVGTIDYVDENGFTHNGNAYKKVDNPDNGERGTYVLGIDGRAVAIDDFGKNVTNSDNTTDGSYVQTQNEGDSWTWETNGNPWFLKNLPDKSNDTLFTDFVGKNTAGQFGKIGFQAFKATALTWSQAEALEFGQILNGGAGSAGMMSVNTISPPLFEREDNDVYLVLRGANLYLNADSMSIEILRASDNVVLATVPNSQISLYADGLSLVFYYNYNALSIGDYKLRLKSGAKILTTSLQFKIVSSVENIDISSITWNKLVDSTYITNDMSTGAGAQVNMIENKVNQVTATPVISFLSSKMFDQGDDWYVELQVTTGAIPIDSSIGVYTAVEILRIGVCYSNVQNSLSFIPIHFWRYLKTWAGGTLSTNINPNTGNTDYSGQSTISKTIVLSITKLGNLLTITDGSQVGFITISNNSGYALSAQLKGIGSNNTESPNQAEAPTLIITKAFKII